MPLAFLDGITGVFFRALALTMVVALLTSLVLAVTLTPSLAAWLLRDRRPGDSGPRRRLPAAAGRARLRSGAAAGAAPPCGDARGVPGPAAAGRRALPVPSRASSCPTMDEGGFVIDYLTPPGTSLAETDRQLLQAEAILRATPEVESYSRRTGARLALSIAEPNTGDFLVKLRNDREAHHRGGERGAAAQFNAAAARRGLGVPRHPRRPDRRPDVVAGADRDQAVLDRHGAAEEERRRRSRSASRRCTGVVDTFDGLDLRRPDDQPPRAPRGRAALRPHRATTWPRP